MMTPQEMAARGAMISFYEALRQLSGTLSNLSDEEFIVVTAAERTMVEHTDSPDFIRRSAATNLQFLTDTRNATRAADNLTPETRRELLEYAGRVLGEVMGAWLAGPGSTCGDPNCPIHGGRPE